MPSRARQANEAWEAFLTAHALLMKRFAAESNWADVSMREYDVLYTLAKQGKPTRPTDLGRNVLLSQPALSRLIDRLVDRGLIERSSDPGDRRGTLLTLTEKGSETQRHAGRPHALSVTRKLTTALDDEELVTLERLCQKLATSAAD